MQHRLLVRVLHSVAYFHEKFQALVNVEFISIAIIRDRRAWYILHYEIWLAVGGSSSVKSLGNRWMVHDSQRLPLGLEPMQHRVIAHAGSDEFQRHLPPYRGRLFCQPDLSHAALTEFLQ